MMSADVESPEDAIVSPAARRIIEEHHLDISTIKGTGKDGRIIKEDAAQAAETTKPRIN